MTKTSSLVMARSVSRVVTPRSTAVRKAANVFSGAKPRAPRWPCRSKAPADTRLAAQIAQASDAVGNGRMSGQMRRSLSCEALHRMDDEEMLRGTARSGKGRRLVGELAERRDQAVG